MALDMKFSAMFAPALTISLHSFLNWNSFSLCQREIKLFPQLKFSIFLVKTTENHFELSPLSTALNGMKTRVREKMGSSERQTSSLNESI